VGIQLRPEDTMLVNSAAAKKAVMRHGDAEEKK
jgi:hypothetical protein